MNVAGLAGFILCFAAIIFGIATNGGIGTIFNFIHFPSLIVTLGGSFFAVLATADSMSDFLDGLTSIFHAYQTQVTSPEDISDEILGMADIARKEGLLSLEDHANKLEHAFLAKGVKLIVDGTDPELIRDILESELVHKYEKGKKRVHFWQDLGSYAPAWGMIGTLLGLINMMKSMGSDPSAVGAGMSLALITTLYGSVIANWICIPVAKKIEKNEQADQLIMELVIEGVLSIQAGENPRIIREKIMAILENNMDEDEMVKAQS